MSRDRYFAEIKVERSAAFRAPTFEIKVDGLSDADWKAIAGGSSPHTLVRIELGWRDLGGGAMVALKSFGSMFTGGSGTTSTAVVMIGRIQEATRKAGEFQYIAEFRGVDYRWAQMARTKAELEIPKGATVDTVVKNLCDIAHVSPLHIPKKGWPKAKHPSAEKKTMTVLDYLRTVGKQAHPDGQGKEIPMFLRADGFHVGPWKAPIVPGAEHVHALDRPGGLADVKPVKDETRQEFVVAPFAIRPVRELSYDATLLGRAEIDLGDVANVEVDEVKLGNTGPSSAFGALGDVVGGLLLGGPGPPAPTESEWPGDHHVSRAQGFTSVVRVEPQPKEDGATESDAEAARREPDEAHATAAVIDERERKARETHEIVGIGVVQSQHVAEGTDLSQRVGVQEGLEPVEMSDRATRAFPAKDAPVRPEVPYLTPFAFGETGLVVPHYPGMRAAVLHYQGLPTEPIMAGCLWEAGTEPGSKIGDWWLSLPTNVSPADTSSDPTAVSYPSGPASHDLIDASGARLISVKGLRITIGKGLMKDAGTRPDDPPQDVLKIEHEKGKARIEFDADGNITIATDGKLTIEANSVDVKVTGAMEVKNR